MVKRRFHTTVLVIIFLLLGPTALAVELSNGPYPPSVQSGATGPTVEVLQKYLNILGLYYGKIDGKFGDSTQEAVMTFQKKVFLPATGSVDDTTWRSIREVLTQRPLIVGYYNSGGVYDSLPVLKQHGESMTAIAPVWFWVENDGSINGKIDTVAVWTARQMGVRVLGLVSNLRYDTSTAKAQVHNILRNSSLGRKVISGILWMVDRFDLDGINLDFEYVQPEDRAAFSAWVRDLGDQLRMTNKWFTISTPAKTADKDSSYGFNGGFDYKALSNSADHLMLMAYDKHWAGGEPGPVAPIDWINDVLLYARKTIHPAKIVLGLNAYGYDWYSDTARAKALVMRNVEEWAAARSAHFGWDSKALVPFAWYVDSEGKKHQAWFENAESIGKKMDLVSYYSVAGLAWWRMGYEDQSFWDAINKRWPYPTSWQFN